MRFKDEKKMWYADTELLAARLANKTELQVQQILDDHDVIKLYSGDRPKVGIFGRLLFLPVCLVLIPVSVIKWFATGDRYLDVYAKRFPLFDRVMNYCGIK